jgi:hypothetical protein
VIDAFEVVIAIATGIATLGSLAAIIISVVAYRQRIKYHPQPFLDVEWDTKLTPYSGIFVRYGQLFNHGDAPARDVRLSVTSGITKNGEPWMKQEIIQPSKFMNVIAPVVDRVTMGQGGIGLVFNREGDPADYKFVTPVLTVTWRQPPFEGKQHLKPFTAPHTPDLKNGETT